MKLEQQLTDLQNEYKNTLLQQLSNDETTEHLRDTKQQLSGAIQIVQKLIDEEKKALETKEDINATNSEPS